MEEEGQTQEGNKDFTLPDTVSSLDDLPAAVREFYHEADGQYKKRNLQVVENAMKNAKAERDRRTKELEEARKQLDKYKDFDDFDMEELTKLREERAAAEERKAKEAGEFDKLRQKLIDDHHATIEKHLSREKFLESALRVEKVDNRLKDELVRAGATPEGMDLLPTKLAPRVELNEADGSFKEKILDKDGQQMFGKEGVDAAMADLVAQAKEDYPSLFKSTGATGSGAPQSNGSGAAQSFSKAPTYEQLKNNPSAKAAFIKEHGAQAWVDFMAKQSADDKTVSNVGMMAVGQPTTGTG